MGGGSVKVFVHLCVACLIMKTVKSIDVEDFFPQVRGNLTKVTWAHAVNNASFLSTSLQDNATMMLEADVQLGTISGSTDNVTIPIMAHPPNNVSDLSLETFLTTIQNFNNNVTASNQTRKGAKLDFKTIEAFNASLAIINQHYNGSFPLWINADILPGPINATTVPVNATAFFEGCKNFSSTTLSVGWTTEYGANVSGSYSAQHIDQMVALVSQQNTTNRFTFPVRAGLAAESSQQLQRLLNTTSNSTLTIWSSPNDNVTITNLRLLISEVGVQRIFIDVPKDVQSKLNLDNLPITGTTNGPQTSASTQQSGSTQQAGTTQKPSGGTQVVASLIVLITILLMLT